MESEQPKTPDLSSVIMTEMVLPQHTNALGTVFGGVIMSWVDIAAAISAQRHSEQNVVTASMDAMHFMEPIRLGWTVSIFSRVNMVAKHSCEVGVRVVAESHTLGQRCHTASAYLTMVSLDENNQKVVMPKLCLETEEDRRRHVHALSRRASRIELRETLRLKKNE